MKNTTSKSAASAAFASLVAASGAQGIIHYFDNTNAFSVGLGSSTDVNWDIDGINGADALWEVYYGGSYLYLNDGGFGKSFAGVVSGNYLNNLASGYAVSASRSFSSNLTLISDGSFAYLNGFTSGVEGSFGFRFDDGDGLVFGWADATFFSGGSGGVTVHEWAFQDDGSSIAVGAIPEPATTAIGLGALALGAAGLRRWRKAKQAV